MKKFEFEALAADGGLVKGTLEAESSQAVVNKLQEQGLVAVKLTPVSDRAEDRSTASASPSVLDEAMNCHAYGWKIRLRKLLVFYIPFLIVAGIGFYLLFAGKPGWLVFILMVAGLFLFGFIGSREEAKLLGSFACPRCQIAIPDWDADANHCIIYSCSQCGRKWDIGYKLRSRNHG